MVGVTLGYVRAGTARAELASNVIISNPRIILDERMWILIHTGLFMIFYQNSYIGPMLLLSGNYKKNVCAFVCIKGGK